MEIKQRAGWVYTHFEFGDEVLNYTHRTMMMTRGRAISYAAIELEERSTLVRQNLWVLMAGLALLVVGLALLVFEMPVQSMEFFLFGALVTLWGCRKLNMCSSTWTEVNHSLYWRIPNLMRS